MLKPLLEFILLAVMVGSVEGSAVIPREVQDQAVRRLPSVVLAALPRATNAPVVGLPTVESRDVWPKLRDPESLGVLVTAGSALVVDRDNGKVLFEKNADQVRPIASITKLMTMLVFLERNPDLTRSLTIMAEDIGDGLGTIFVPGDNVILNDLLSATLVGSANDAARALVRATGYDEPTFVRLMNAKAHALGMTSTHFVEPTGLDRRNVSTARELTMLVRLVRTVSLLEQIVQQPVYRTNGSTKKSQFIRSTNLLLASFLNQPPYHIALAKTGSLDEAGYCFAASINEGNHGVIAIVLGSETHFSRFDDMKALAYWALSKWQWPK